VGMKCSTCGSTQGTFTEHDWWTCAGCGDEWPVPDDNEGEVNA
jgi:ribosomal protein L37AE/L43A